MNEVFIIAKVISNVEFNFILNSKNISLSQFEVITITNKQRINIVAYNELADYVYQNIKQGNTVFINGYISSNKLVVKLLDIIY